MIQNLGEILTEMKLNLYDKAILYYLASQKEAKSTLQISMDTKMHWNTARKHLEKLFKAGYVAKYTIRTNKKIVIVMWNAL